MTDKDSGKKPTGCIVFKAQGPLSLQGEAVPLPGVYVSLTGPVTKRDPKPTDADGTACFQGLPIGERYTVTCSYKHKLDNDEAIELELERGSDWSEPGVVGTCEAVVKVEGEGTCSSKSACAEIKANYRLPDEKREQDKPETDASKDNDHVLGAPAEVVQARLAADFEQANVGATDEVMLTGTRVAGVASAGGPTLELLEVSAFAKKYGIPPNDLEAFVQHYWPPYKGEGCIRVRARIGLPLRGGKETYLPLRDVDIRLTDGSGEVQQYTDEDGEACFDDRVVGARYTVICPSKLDLDDDGIHEFELEAADGWERSRATRDKCEFEVWVLAAASCDGEQGSCVEVSADYKLQDGQAKNIQDISAAVDDLANYAAPAVLMADATGAGSVAPAGGPALKSMVRTAFAEVLGVPPGDLEAVKRALPQRFERKEGPGGRTVYEWKPGALVVETMFGAAKLTGNQARLYQPAERLLEESRELLDKMLPLQPAPDEDLVAARKATVLSLMEHLVAEFGRELEPREVLVDQFLKSLGEELPKLATALGYEEEYIINLGDEEQWTYGLILADNVDKLERAWRDYDAEDKDKKHSLNLGAQFRRLSRDLATVAESVQETRAMLASVRFGPAEQRTRRYQFASQTEKMTVDDLLSAVERFATVKAPRFVQEGNRVGVGPIKPLAEQLKPLVEGARDYPDHPFVRGRVREAFKELAQGLDEVINITGELTGDWRNRSSTTS